MFESAYLKIERAKQHLAELETTLATFVEKNKGAIIRKLSPAEPIKYVSFSAIGAPAIIPLIIGDVAHNLRSALDHVAGELRRGAGADDSQGHFLLLPTGTLLYGPSTRTYARLMVM